MKKGFTLIEILVVILLVGVIALIATPIILNTVEEAKKNSVKQSAIIYIRGLNSTILTKRQNSDFTSTSCVIRNSVLTCSNDALEYETSGSIPKLGYINIVNGDVGNYSLCIDNYKVVTTGETTVVTKESDCTIDELDEISSSLTGSFNLLLNHNSYLPKSEYN